MSKKRGGGDFFRDLGLFLLGLSKYLFPVVFVISIILLIAGVKGPKVLGFNT
jgi:hypothetical protein